MLIDTVPNRRNLTQEQQLEYIDAVRCLQNRPSQLNEYWQGAKDRFDDFQALHIKYTDFIHFCVRIRNRLWYNELTSSNRVNSCRKCQATKTMFHHLEDYY
jgi:hypothetical protein